MSEYTPMQENNSAFLLQIPIEIVKSRQRKGEKTIVYTNMKQVPTKCGVTLCGVQGNVGKNAIKYTKWHIDEFICFS